MESLIPTYEQLGDWLEELMKKTRWAVEGLERAENHRQAEKLAQLKDLLSALEDKKCTL